MVDQFGHEVDQDDDTFKFQTSTMNSCQPPFSPALMNNMHQFQLDPNNQNIFEGQIDDNSINVEHLQS